MLRSLTDEFQLGTRRKPSPFQSFPTLSTNSSTVNLIPRSTWDADSFPPQGARHTSLPLFQRLLPQAIFPLKPLQKCRHFLQKCWDVLQKCSGCIKTVRPERVFTAKNTPPQLSLMLICTLWDFPAEQITLTAGWTCTVASHSLSGL